MKNLQLFAFGSAALFAAGSLMLAACSEDTVVTPLDPDAGVDASHDSSTSDSSVDSGVDSGKDSGADADAGLTLDDYVNKVGEALCSSLTRCCFGDPNVPDGGTVTGGKFDQFACVSAQRDLGFELTNVNADLLTAGHYTLDQQKAADCIAKVDSYACELSGASLKQIRSVCFEALQGTLADGTACKASIECREGSFCKPTDPTAPASGGTCAPLVASGGSCGELFMTGDDSTDAQSADEACSSRAAGNEGLHCLSYTNADGYLARTDWKCAPAVAVGGECSTTLWCASGICDPGPDFDLYVCKDPLQYNNDNFCKSYVKP